MQMSLITSNWVDSRFSFESDPSPSPPSSPLSYAILNLSDCHWERDAPHLILILLISFSLSISPPKKEEVLTSQVAPTRDSPL